MPDYLFSPDQDRQILIATAMLCVSVLLALGVTVVIGSILAFIRDPDPGAEEGKTDDSRTDQP